MMVQSGRLRADINNVFVGGREKTRRRVSRVLYHRETRAGSVDGGGHSSGTPVAERLLRPTRAAMRRYTRRYAYGTVRRNWRPPPLLGLAPGGVFHAATVAGGAVRSYRTISPLPPIRSDRNGLGGVFSVALSLGSPPPGVTRHRISVEPGLSSPRAKLGAAARPSGAFDMDKGGVIVKALCEAARDRLREG